MKFLVILILLVVAAWLWRHNRIAAAKQAQLQRQRQSEALKQQAKPPLHAPMLAVDIVACANCGVHIPQPDALSGKTGRWYCCEAHRKSGEAKNP